MAKRHTHGLLPAGIPLREPAGLMLLASGIAVILLSSRQRVVST